MPHGSMHIGGDMLERFKPEALAVLRDMLARAEMTLDQRLCMHNHSGGDSGLETVSSIVAEIGEHFIVEAWSAIKHRDCLVADMRCFKHGGECAAWPSTAIRADRRMLAIGGNTCTPWSRMGSRRRWVHPASLCLLLWVKELTVHQPNVVVQECTPEFDHQTFERLLETCGGLSLGEFWACKKDLISLPSLVGLVKL